MISLEQALAFTATVHDTQKKEDLWLAQHPFVRAVRAGSAGRHELNLWVSQVYCATRAYSMILESLSPPPPVGVWTDPWRDIDLLFHLGCALGTPRHELAMSRPNLATRSVQIWLRQHLTIRSRHIPAQVCWALVEAMSPETGASLAEGSVRHLGLQAKHLGYFKIGMTSRQRADKYAANLLTQIAIEDWGLVREQTLMISRLMVRLYDSIADASSTW